MANNDQTAFSRQLRKDSTGAERTLWSALRAHRLSGLKFKRQEPIGPYVADFVCFEKKIVIEVDGGQHAEEVEQQRDRVRTEWLESQGFRVLRFGNNDVLTNIDGVIDMIWEAVSPSP